MNSEFAEVFRPAADEMPMDAFPVALQDAAYEFRFPELLPKYTLLLKSPMLIVPNVATFAVNLSMFDSVINVVNEFVFESHV
jgi:hypothetical protein